MIMYMLHAQEINTDYKLKKQKTSFLGNQNMSSDNKVIGQANEKTIFLPI